MGLFLFGVVFGAALALACMTLRSPDASERLETALAEVSSITARYSPLASEPSQENDG